MFKALPERGPLTVQAQPAFPAGPCRPTASCCSAGPDSRLHLALESEHAESPLRHPARPQENRLLAEVGAYRNAYVSQRVGTQVTLFKYGAPKCRVALRAARPHPLLPSPDGTEWRQRLARFDGRGFELPNLHGCDHPKQLGTGLRPRFGEPSGNSTPPTRNDARHRQQDDHWGGGLLPVTRWRRSEACSDRIP